MPCACNAPVKKLAKDCSNKTWSGFFGGLLASLLPPWTGWIKKKNAASQLLLLLLHAGGKDVKSILLTLQVTLTLL